MSVATLLMLIILILGIIGRTNIIAAAATILLLVQFTNLERFFPLLQRRGLELGLLFLVISVLVPFAAGKVPLRKIVQSFFSIPGFVAIISGVIATHLNGKGLNMLQATPELMIGLVVGSILGITLLGGIPVGPLMAGGIAAIIMQILNFFKLQ